jgi:hypothetical protein
MIIHRQHGGGKQAELLKNPQWKDPVLCPVWHVHRRYTRVKGLVEGENPSRLIKTPKSAATQEDDFIEVRRRKQHNTNETAPTSKKAACNAVDRPSKEVATPTSSPRSEHLTWTWILLTRDHTT